MKMYKKRVKNRPENILTPTNRGSDIQAPNNTSLIVNRSSGAGSNGNQNDSPITSVASLLEDDDDDSILLRPSSSLITSMSQKKQSTPNATSAKRSMSYSQSRFTKSPSEKSGSDSSFMQERLISRNGTSKNKTPNTISSNQELNIFLTFLKECGTEETPDGSYRLSEDQALFALKLNKKLNECPDFDLFVKCLKEYVEDTEKLKQLVVFTQTTVDCALARGPVQDPMLKLLLLVDTLQETLLQMLLEKIAAMIIDSPDGGDLTLISAVLRQARCLNRVKNTKLGYKLFELIEVAPTNVKREIIFLLPELIIEEELNYAATQLVELLNDNAELTTAIIESLGNLPLTSALKDQVRAKVLLRLNKVPISYLPSITQFVISSCDPSNLLQVITSLREQLPFIPARWAKYETEFSKNEHARREVDSYIRLTFDNLKGFIMSSKPFSCAWIKAIQEVPSPEDFRPVDLIMMVLIHGHDPARKPTVLTLLKSKIRAGIVTSEHVSHALKILGVVALENHMELLEVASTLLKSFEQSIADFSAVLYSEIFISSNGLLRRDVICDVIPHILSGSSCTLQNTLNLLARLRNNHQKEMEEQAITLISLLTKLPDLTILQVRQLVDVISSLATSPTQSDTSLLDDLQIFIHKKLSAWQSDTQKKGTVAAIMLLKHVTLSGAQDADDQWESLLSKLHGVQSASSSKRMFFYDEIATMIREIDVRSTLITGLHDQVLTLLTEQIFVDDLEFDFGHFPIALQFSIDNADKMVLPMVNFLVKPPKMGTEVISAALRLLWCTEKNVSSLINMMCAPVILPDASVFEKFMTYQVHHQKMIMDCLFHCANYFIECINALSTQKTSDKLVIRLKQLIEVWKLISQHAGQVVDYVPPLCQQHTPATKPVFKKPAAEGKKPKRGRKRKSDGTTAAETQTQGNNDILDASVLPCTSTAAPTDAIAESASTPADATNMAAYSSYFRDLHCHAFKLLRMEMKLNPTKIFKKKKMSDLIVCDVSWSYRPQDKPELGPSDMLFLLQDYMNKSENILRERPPFLAKRQPSLLSETIAPATFLLVSVKLLPKLCMNLDIASGYCKDLLDSCDGIWDAPGVFPKESADIKSVFCAIVRIISDIMSWRGFQQITHKTILKDALTVLARRSGSTSTQSSASLAVEAAQYLANLGDIMPQLSGGVSLVRAVQACLQYSSNPKDLSLVGELCDSFLRRPWFTLNAARESGSIYNQQVDSLLRTYFASATDGLETVKKVAEIALDEVKELTSKDSQMETLKTLNKSNFPLLFRALCEALVSASSKLISESKDDDESISIWAKVTKILKILVDIAKDQTSRTNLASILKRSQAIIQLFLNKGLPVMEPALRVKSKIVLSILKSLQYVTRFLHNVCCHSKVTSDAVVAAHVPAIRSLCERLTLEVKGMLILNKIPPNSIEIAVLKNRDIQGNAILSQTLEESDDEEDLPPESELTDGPECEAEVTLGEASSSDAE